MGRATTSLGDLGFKFYYDENHRHEVDPSSNFNVQPGSTIEFYYGMRPYQKDDGKWYTKDVTLTGDTPFVVAGLYEKTKKPYLFTIGTRDESDFSDISVSEFSFWKKELSIESLQNIEDSGDFLVGGENSYYQSVFNAESDKLTLHYEFDTTIRIEKNYNSDSISAEKNTEVEIEPDSVHNGNRLQYRGSTISMSGAFGTEFTTTRIRFKKNDENNCVIFSSEFFSLTYDESNKELLVKVSNFFEEEVFVFSAVSINIRKWNTITVVFGQEKSYLMVGKKILGDFFPSDQMKEFELVVNTENVENIDITSGKRLEFWGMTKLSSYNKQYTSYKISDSYYDPETVYIEKEDSYEYMVDPDKNHVDINIVPIFRDLLKSVNRGQREVLDPSSVSKLLYNEENDSGAFTITGRVEYFYDLYSGNKEISIPSKIINAISLNDYWGDMDYIMLDSAYSITTNTATGKSKVGFGKLKSRTTFAAGWSDYKIIYDMDNIHAWLNMKYSNANTVFSGEIGESLKVSITFKDVFENDNIPEPMLVTLPGTKIVVREYEVNPGV